jgi:hypothetical protein
LIRTFRTSDHPREGAPIHAALTEAHPQILIIAPRTRT